MGNAMSTDTDNQLLSEIKNSITDMQEQMQSTYSNLADIKLTGESYDKSVKITMSATYNFEGIKFGEKAFGDGVKGLEVRITEAWKDLSEKIQQTTQSKTMELLQSMQIPEDIKNISMEQAKANEGGE